ncbi:hypothetical protein GCM10010156_07240 [Planobispora rosea]|uniref:Uncharacterized protein n=1 Tax=Planobispora rosea TaxID=35762 RepID=A0A8J3S3G7_PLARO|nr:hypothetical protein [Planobispora rosea]GGS51238.1 hypothetical protein GCM10010156_07240 [Planobispora rosea]GIH82888.1 hypothetical protein Pro02_12960 [Planobispora rosea]
MSSKSRQTKAQHQQQKADPVRKGPGPVTSAQLREEKGRSGRGGDQGSGGARSQRQTQRLAKQSMPLRRGQHMGTNRQG